MQFNIELLTKNTNINEIDKLILDSDLFETNPINRVKINDKYIPVDHSAKYRVVFDNRDFKIHVKRLTGGLLTILLIFEYKKNKLLSAKKFEIFYSKFKEFLRKNDLESSVIRNELSEYFAQRLYPKFQKYELALRHIFILALSPLEDENVIKVVKLKTNGKLDLAQIHTISRIENLQISELHTFVFDTNLNPIENIELHFENFQSKSDVELKKLIQSSFRVTIWERHFTKFLPDGYNDILKDNHEKIRTYRNDIMHFHTLSFRRYKKIDSLISEGIDELSALSENMLINWNFDSTRKLINDLSTSELFVSMGKLSKTISDTMKPALEQFYVNNTDINLALKSMVETFKNIQLPKIDPNVFKALQNMSTSLGRVGLQNPDYDFDDLDINLGDSEE